MTPSKPPTASGISRLLAGAGFEKSAPKPSRIKGMQEWSAGYHVAASLLPGCVLVEHRVNSLHLRSASRATVEAERRAAYAGAITAAGWNVESTEHALIVTAKAEEG
ncbi:MAG TPA: hypothetical protein VGS62_06880 [Streptosporangiaceae bacterium]|nr:hypothetical protein [Streptosporangiaceae bacterium]